MELDFEIDKITESIENAETGEALETLVLPVTEADLKEITKKNGWLFDWRLEYNQIGHKTFKLVTKKEPQTIHGLLSLEIKHDHVFMHLVENAPFNIGKGKKFLGVCGNLTAYGCKISKEHGFDGEVVFVPKTALIEHYQKTLGAVMISKNRMAILEDRALLLLEKYFPEMEDEQ